MAAPDEHDEGPGSTSRTLEVLREMIRSGELLPGQQLRQTQLAAQLGISRVPLREALTTLVSEGVVDHALHSGYTVARFRFDELEQTYLMRRLLEGELLARIESFPAEALTAMERESAAMRAASEAGDVGAWSRHNRAFHFAIFHVADKRLVAAEIERLWNMSEFYRSLYLYDRGARDRAADEHDEVIALARAGDVDRLRDVLAAHRHSSETKLKELLHHGMPPFAIAR